MNASIYYYKNVEIRKQVVNELNSEDAVFIKKYWKIIKVYFGTLPELITKLVTRGIHLLVLENIRRNK